MPNCRSSSPGSAPCLLELQWRPSRWLLAALLILSVLAPLSVLGSELPRALAWPLAVAAAAWGLDACRREAGRAPRRLVLAPASGSGGGAAGQDSLDGRPLARCELAWRGPLAFVHGCFNHGIDWNSATSSHGSTRIQHARGCIDARTDRTAGAGHLPYPTQAGQSGQGVGDVPANF